MTAAEKIKKAIDENPDHDEEGLTRVDARWTVEAAAAAKPSRIVNDLAMGAKGALKGHPEGVPLMVFHKTHDLRHLLIQLPAAAPAVPAPAVAPAVQVPAEAAATVEPEADHGPAQ